MNRKQFIEYQGATCRNWAWSWSFINESKQIIIFGAWDVLTRGNTSLIFSESWKTDQRGKKKPAYEQSLEHIRLIEGGYQLKTFSMIYSDAKKDIEGAGPAKIARFDHTLTTKFLCRVGGNWYAFGDAISNFLSEEVDTPERYIEGASKLVSVNTYERNSNARTECIRHHGYKCAVCSFNFENIYGAIGKDYIHVHHIVSLSEIKEEYTIDPHRDLVPVCPNCHAIIHKTHPPLTVEQLKEHLEECITR